jgi:imidazolonepropionase-like amidohydrolase
MKPLKLLILVMIGVTILSAQENKKQNQIIIKNVKIFDGTSDQLTNEMNILIKNNLIVNISKESIPTNENTIVIDGGGRVLTPGFIDAHTHIALIAPFDQLENEFTGVYIGAAGGQVAENMLMRGFTTVRDAGGASIGIQRAIDDGWFPGPRIYSSGAFITQTSGHLDMRDRTNPHHYSGGSQSHAQQIGHFTAIDGKAEMLAAGRQNFRDGATQLKLATNGGISATYSPLDIDQFTDEELGAASHVAESFGSYFMVHAYYDNAVSRAIDFGAKSIEHGHLMTEPVVKKMADDGVYLVVEALMSMAEAPASFTADQREKFELVKSGFTNMIELAKKYNLKIALGSDTFLSKEAYEWQALEWIARSKLFTSLEIMKQATSIGAELVELSGMRNRFREGKLGVIQVGAYADLVIVDGNPLEDVSILSDYVNNIELIMKDGIVYKNTLKK